MDIQAQRQRPHGRHSALVGGQDHRRAARRDHPDRGYRPHNYNRFDPDAFFGWPGLLRLRQRPEPAGGGVLRPWRELSRGIDVDAFAPLAKSGKPFEVKDGMLTRCGEQLSKPLVVVVHGDTWKMGHELHLVADIRVVASADVRFGQDENTHGRFPGGGSTIRFPREAGWGNAMRYMLTGDHWGAEEAFRMGIIQEIAPDPTAALETGISVAQKIAACGPLGIKTTLESAHLSIDESEARRSPSSMNSLAGYSKPTTSWRVARLRQRDVRPSTTASKWASAGTVFVVLVVLATFAVERLIVRIVGTGHLLKEDGPCHNRQR